MRTLFLLATVLLIGYFSNSGNAQDLNVLDCLLAPGPFPDQTEFHFIHPNFFQNAGKRVALIEAGNQKPTFAKQSQLYEIFWRYANKLKANAYAIDSVYLRNDSSFVRIAIYRLSASQLEKNQSYYPADRIYVFRDLSQTRKPEKDISLRVNRTPVVLEEGEFAYYQATGEEDIRIKFKGALYRYDVAEEEETVFLALVKESNKASTGLMFGLSGILIASRNNGVLREFDENLGFFLVYTLKMNTANKGVILNPD